MKPASTLPVEADPRTPRLPPAGGTCAASTTTCATPAPQQLRRPACSTAASTAPGCAPRPPPAWRPPPTGCARPAPRLAHPGAGRPAPAARAGSHLGRRRAGTPMAMYFADPARGSIHSFGMAVDVTLLDPLGREVDMGSGFDEMSLASHPALHAEHLASGVLTPGQVALRERLAATPWRPAALPASPPSGGISTTATATRVRRERCRGSIESEPQTGNPAMKLQRRRWIQATTTAAAAVALPLLAASARAQAPAQAPARPLVRARRLQPGDTVALVNPSGAIYERAPYDIATENAAGAGLQGARGAEPARALRPLRRHRRAARGRHQRHVRRPRRARHPGDDRRLGRRPHPAPDRLRRHPPHAQVPGRLLRSHRARQRRARCRPASSPSTARWARRNGTNSAYDTSAAR